MFAITSLKLLFSSITSTTRCDLGTWANPAAAIRANAIAANTPLPRLLKAIKKSPFWTNICFSRAQAKTAHEPIGRLFCLAVGEYYRKKVLLGFKKMKRFSFGK